MNMTPNDSEPRFSPKTFQILLVLGVAAILIVGLYGLAPKTKKSRPERPVPLVRVMEIAPVREPVHLEAYGTVIPARQVILQAEVEGRVVGHHPDLVPGGIIEKGSLVAQLDPVDYEFLVAEAKADLAQAEYELELEQGQQVIARHEWDLLEKELGPAMLANRRLALREPHLIQAQAKLAAAESRLAAAELALRRTSIVAPFHGIVLSEAIEIGQLVSKQSNLATLAGVDSFWVQVAVPVESLARIRFPERRGRKGSPARIFLESEGKEPVRRDGSVYKLLGELDPQGRMARLLVTIHDPLALSTAKGGSGGRILLGSYVKVAIDSGMLDGVYVLPREAVRAGDRLWLVDGEGRLAVRQAEVVWRRKDELLVRAEIMAGERLVVSRLQAPLPGMKVEIESSPAPPVQGNK